ncbi:MAG: sugar phosphate isomerase/epimerase [bacterium]|nr:sugar phosphate isomerase/epimerase [bacterium]
MKAGVCSYCFNPLFTENQITMMEAIEFVGTQTEADCFEPLSRFWDPDRDENDQAKEASDLMSEHNLEASCYTLDSDFAVYDEAVYRACIERCIERLDTALLLHTDTIRLDPRSSLPGPPEEADLDDVLERIAKGMAEITDAAADKKIKVGVENHGRLLGRTAQTLKIIELVNKPNFGVNIDFTNFRQVFGEDHVEATRQLADRVVHAHAKDFHLSKSPQEGEEWHQLPSGEYSRRAIGGEGDMQWPTLFTILKRAGYSGTISLEITDPNDIKGSIAKGVANIKRIVTELNA